MVRAVTSDSAACGERHISSVGELVDAADGGSPRVRVGDAVVSILLVNAVRLWVEATAANVQVSVSGGVLAFRGASGRCWLKDHAAFRAGNRRLRGFLGVGADCYLCGKTLRLGQRLEIDHWYPRSLGGPDEPWNLRLVHAGCNRSKADAVLPAAHAEYLSRQHARSAAADGGS